MLQHRLSIRVVVLAALDGSPFDPYVSTTTEADESWQALRRAHVPVVFFSSRTRAELEAISQAMGVRYPFVAEDGGAFYAPTGYFGSAIRGSRDVAGYEAVQFGRPYREVLDGARKIARQAGIEVIGFSDMSVSEVASECGLPLLQARLAKLRDHTELLRIVSDDPAAPMRFARALRSARLRCVDCDRYVRVGSQVDSAAVANLVIGLFRESFPEVQVIGIADPVADAALLQRVDFALSDSSGMRRIASAPESSSPSEAIGDRASALLRLMELARRSLESVRHSRS